MLIFITLLYLWAAATIFIISLAIDSRAPRHTHILTGIFWFALLPIFGALIVYEWLNRNS